MTLVESNPRHFDFSMYHYELYFVGFFSFLNIMIDAIFKYDRNANRIMLFLTLKRWNLKSNRIISSQHTELYLLMLL